MRRLAESAASRGLAFPALLAFSVAASLLMGFSFRIMFVNAGLDPSYMYAYNYAAVHPEKWGREFVSTYGPYGYLIGTMDLGRLVARQLVFSGLLAIGFGIAAAVYVRSVPGLGWGAQLALTAVIIYAFGIQGREYAWFTLFILVFLTGLLARSDTGLVGYALAGLLAGFYLLIKFSLGLAAVVTVVVGCALARRPDRVALRLLATGPAVIAGFLIGWASAGSHLDGIGTYLRAGWEMSRGYSSAMSIGPEASSDVVHFLAWFGMLGLWVWMQPSPGNRLALTALAVPLFVAWKHSIVREDMQHVGILVKFGVFVLAVLLAQAAAAWRWRYTLPAIGLLLVPLALTWATRPERSYSLTLGRPLASPVRLGGATDLAQVFHLARYRDRMARMSARSIQSLVLPEGMRQTIGQATVDVYPWLISYVPANNLSWANRPVPASFNAFTPALDELNTAFFQSNARPEYLIWHGRSSGEVTSIDGRYLLWDEPRTFRVIASSYDVAAADDRVMLLRARSGCRFAEPQPLGTSTVPWDTRVTVPRSRGVVLAAVSVQASPLRSLVRTVFREDAVYLSLRLGSDPEQVQRFRLVLDNINSGLWLSPLAITFSELPRLLQHGQGRHVDAISFDGSPLVRALIQSFSVSWSQMLPLEATAAAARIPDPGKPVHAACP